MGLTASGTKLGSRDWQKAQVAMSLLKEGQSLESAADQARISVKKLKQYIALGIKKNA
jgi:lambda repressor-like predicted transcriptional regulator